MWNWLNTRNLWSIFYHCSLMKWDRRNNFLIDSHTYWTFFYTNVIDIVHYIRIVSIYPICLLSFSDLTVSSSEFLWIQLDWMVNLKSPVIFTKRLQAVGVYFLTNLLCISHTNGFKNKILWRSENKYFVCNMRNLIQ